MADSTARVARRGRSRYLETLRNIRKYWYGYLLVAGTVSLLGTFSYYPAISALYHAFTIWDGISPGHWAGLKNFQEIATRDVFRQAFGNVALLATWRVVRSVTAPLFVAALIHRFRNEAVAYFFRLVFVLPIVVPPVVGVLVWKQFLDPNMGLFNDILNLVGLKGLLWLNSADTALPSLMFVGFPWVDGVAVLIYLAGLQGIPEEIIDAAIVDGARSLRRFFSVELPLIIPQFRVILILSSIRALQEFGWQLLITKGGPGNATTVPAWLMYGSALRERRFGLASAIGFVLFIVIFTLTLINNRAVRGSVEFEA